MGEYSRQFLERTIEVWQPYSPTQLSLEDAREIADNMVHLFSILGELEENLGEGNTVCASVATQAGSWEVGRGGLDS